MINKNISCLSSIWLFCLFATLTSPLQASTLQKKSATIKPTKGRVQPKKPRPQGRTTAKERPQNKPAPSARPQPQSRPRPQTQRYHNNPPPPYAPPQRGARPAPMQNGQFLPHNQQMHHGMPGQNMPTEEENTHSMGKFFVRWITYIVVEVVVLGLSMIAMGPLPVADAVIACVSMLVICMVFHYISELAIYLFYGSSTSSKQQQPIQPPMRQGPQNQGQIASRFSVPR